MRKTGEKRHSSSHTPFFKLVSKTDSITKDWSQQTSCKESDNTYFRLCWPWVLCVSHSVLLLQREGRVDNTYRDGHGCAPVELHPQEQTVGRHAEFGPWAIACLTLTKGMAFATLPHLQTCYIVWESSCVSSISHIHSDTENCGTNIFSG